MLTGPLPFPTPSCDNQKCLQIWPDVLGVDRITPTENNCPKGKKYSKVGAIFSKAEWSLCTMAMGCAEGSGVRVCYKEEFFKKGRMLKKSWLDKTLLLMGFANIGQPLFKHVNDTGVGHCGGTPTLLPDELCWVARNWERCRVTKQVVVYLHQLFYLHSRVGKLGIYQTLSIPTYIISSTVPPEF